MNVETIIEQLRARGFRITRQRLTILEAIRQHEQHVTAEDVHEAVRRRQPSIDLATVYRTLQWLHDAGLLRKIDVGKERMEYELASAAAHHHLVCRDCGGEQEINNHVMEELRAHILHHYDFEADSDHVAIFGHCAHCRDTETHSSADQSRGSRPHGPSVAHNKETKHAGDSRPS